MPDAKATSTPAKTATPTPAPSKVTNNLPASEADKPASKRNYDTPAKKASAPAKKASAPAKKDEPKPTKKGFPQHVESFAQDVADFALKTSLDLEKLQERHSDLTAKDAGDVAHADTGYELRRLAGSYEALTSALSAMNSLAQGTVNTASLVQP